MPERPDLEVLRVPGRDDAWEVLVDGVRSSLVDLADPARLDFGYMRAFGAVLAGLPDGALRVVHVGGAACTMVRYVQALRPGSPQVVLEPDAALTTELIDRLPLPAGTDVRLEPIDGRSGLAALPDTSADAVLVDAMVAGQVPAELTTVELLRDVDRVLAPTGVLLLNVGEVPGSAYARRVLAGVHEVFAHRLLIGYPTVMLGRRAGNLVVVGSRSALDEAALVERTGAFPHVQGVLRGRLLDEHVGDARPLTDADPLPSPPTPSVPGPAR